MLYVKFLKNVLLVSCLLFLSIQASQKRTGSLAGIDNVNADSVRRKVEKTSLALSSWLNNRENTKIAGFLQYRRERAGNFSDITKKMQFVLSTPLNDLPKSLDEAAPDAPSKKGSTIGQTTKNTAKKSRKGLKPKAKQKRKEPREKVKQQRKSCTPPCYLSSRLDVLKKEQQARKQEVSLPDNFYISRCGSSFIKPGIVTYTFGKNLRLLEESFDFKYRIFVRFPALSINREYTKDLQKFDTDCNDKATLIDIPYDFWEVFQKDTYPGAFLVQRKLHGHMLILKEYENKFLGIGVSSLSSEDGIPFIRLHNTSELVAIKPDICTVYGKNGVQSTLSDGGFFPFCEDLDE